MPRSLLFVCCLLATALSGQSAFRLQSRSAPSSEIAAEHARFTLDAATFRRDLLAKDGHLDLPLPDGTTARFAFTDAPVFEPALAARYPDIRSYRLEGPWGAGRLALSPYGADALVRGPAGDLAIQPTEDGAAYLVFYSHDYLGAELTGLLPCGYDPTHPHEGADLGGDAGAKITGKSIGVPRELRKYDLVLTNTGEFAERVGATKERVLAAFNTAVSTVNVIFEREVGVRMNLLARSESVIYLDPDTDPFTDSDEGTGLLDQVIGAFQQESIPASDYDLGHVMTSRCVDVGGVVSGLACSGSKTRGVTCLQGDNVARTAERIMAHEIAHQFTVSHTWNRCPGNDGQRAGNTAFEPGSGTTIMSYAGACGDQNIGGEDAYYHVASLQQFLNYTRQGNAAGCATVIETDNVTPDVALDYTDGFYIPKSTPFRLTGTATDANDPAEQLTYNWEEYDLGPEVSIFSPRGTAPLFRSVPPSDSGSTRYFPRIDRVANGIEVPEEQLPDYAREMRFRLTARDNNPAAGGVDWAEVRFEVADAGPFVVLDPDLTDGGDWRVGQYREVRWEVASTDVAPVNARSVNILLSDDGGLTFNRVLAAGVANTGRAFVTVPDVPGDAMRVVIEAADNIFFNMNATEFSIRPATEPGFTLSADRTYANVCLPEVVTSTFTAGAVLGYAEPIRLRVDSSALPAGIDVTLSETLILPGQTSTLTADLSGVTATGRIVVPVVVEAPGLDPQRREVVLDVTANDFSDLVLAGPTDGTEGIVLTTDFDWTPSVNATSYEIEVATSPSFAAATIVAEAAGLTQTRFTPAAFFEPNTIYFWRIRPTNSCGPGPWSTVNSFKTFSSLCDELTSADTPVALPGSGGSFTRTSVISVPRQGTVSDLNLPSVRVNYQFASKVTLSLTSPAGTTVQLYAENCFSTNSINLGFDDEAPEPLACPPDDRRVFQPVGDLSDFDGEATAGDWTLTVAVSETNGAAGQIVGWSLELCADLESAPPQTLVNEATPVQPLGRNAVLRSELEVLGSSSPATATYFILTDEPAYGFLSLRGTRLVVGDTFSQADINDNRLVYENLDSTQGADAFGFVVSAEDGGYLPTDYHDFVITADAPSPTRVAEPETQLALYPNPTEGRLSVEWVVSRTSPHVLELYDLNGRLLVKQRLPGDQGTVSLDLTTAPAGVYLLRLGRTVRRVVRR